MNADGLDQAFDNLGKAIKITAGLKGTDKSITEVFKMSGIDEKLEEILWDLLRMDWHINHMAEDLNEKDTADDRQTNVEEAIKELESLIAQQVKEAKRDFISDICDTEATREAEGKDCISWKAFERIRELAK